MILSLQRLAGNAAVAALVGAGDARSTRASVTLQPPGPVPTRSPVTVQREIEDRRKVGEDQMAVAEGEPAQPDLAEAGEGGGALVAPGTNEFGEMDGQLETGVITHAFRSRGKTGTAQWHHAGGPNGGTGYPPGAPTVVAPQYDSAPPASPGKQAKAWIRKDTGTVKVRTWYIGVPKGDNGVATWAGSGGGLVYIASSGVRRVDKHEEGHSSESRRIHNAHIKPMEGRISKYRGALHKNMKAATAPAAVAALQTHVNWNTTLANFANADIAANQPGGTWDTTDQAKANFYHDKGARTVSGTNYGHYIEAP